MHKFIIIFLILLPTPNLYPSEIKWSENPSSFINEFTSRGIEDILQSEQKIDNKTALFRNLINETFDLYSISKFVLGRNWRTSSENEQSEFLTLFEDIIVFTWSKRFDEYNGQSLIVENVIPDGENGVIVNSSIVNKEGSKINVQWRLRKRASGLRIVDIIVEGVSMAITYRQDFNSVIRRNGGIKGLLTALENQIKKMSS